MFRGRVLVAEDEHLLVRQLVSVLERGGFYVEFATNGVSALEMLRRGGSDFFDCAVLDVNMPGKTGLEVLQEIRLNGSKLPVILLTDLSDEMDAVIGFSAGADDYMGKPLRGRELVARVDRLVKGSGDAAAPIAAGSAVFDLPGMQLSGPAGTYDLSVTEVDIMKPLLQPVGRLVPQVELLVSGWGSSDRRNVRNLYEHIRRLRNRLVEAAVDVEIKSVRNAGYRLIPLES